MHKNSSKCAAAALTLATAFFSLPAAAVPYVVGGASQSLISDSSQWAWDGSYMAPLRAALENPANFGPSGIVNQEIDTVTLSAVNASTLAGIDMFVATWISDGQAAPIAPSIVDFFLNGGDLFLLQDDAGHDGVGSALGLSTTASSGTVSNGGVPLFDGPFGVATDVMQLYLVGQLDPLAIAAHSGHVGGTNAQGQVTSAFWGAGEYAAGAGSLFVIADIDMIADTGTQCGLAICGARFSPLNSNGIYALNTFSFLQQNSGGSVPVPEPASLLLLSLGLGALAFTRRRKRA
ncbi:MAG TPA: PEP-CTERM sorting domain-containing protein [Gammaproteobacteria bacterium]|nr:PEP-CTERM sorting domain-containing protein [Gammaproteobacteria bacterium]